MLTKKGDKKIDSRKSYPGLATIISMARKIIEREEKGQIEKVVKLMQGHENQQSATIVATIAILICEKIETTGISVSKECSRALGDIMLWDTPVIKSKESWPSRHHYSFMQILYSEGESKRIAHYENGIWICAYT